MADPKVTPLASTARPLTGQLRKEGADEDGDDDRKARRKAARQQAEEAADGPRVIVRPLARRARPRRRHWGLMVSFLIFVVVPVAAAGWYLYDRAVDQYASSLGFTVRSEDVSSAVDILGSFAPSLGSSGSHDADILYEFIRSQELVKAIDERVDLRSLFSRHAATDPLFSFDPDGTIEDLTAYWDWMLRLSYDTGSGLMEVRILAFEPQEARAIALAVYDVSSEMINALAATAREDSTRYARDELEMGVERLKQAREALTAFRIETQIVDPTADIQGQMGLLNTLQAQLAAALIDLDLLAGVARENDPRLTQAERRIEVIQARIADERQKFGIGGEGPGGENYATTIAEFERLAVDREFAERAYIAALSAYDAARAEADRQTRYLAAYIRPTLAERAEYPQRGMILGIVFLFSFLTWAILSLVYYSLRDRK